MEYESVFELILRIAEKLLIIYFLLYLLIDISFFIYALFTYSRKRAKKTQNLHIPYEKHYISVVVPAYNEEVSIVDCINTLLKLDYPAYEVIVVNDGSGDKTMERIKEHFNLTSENINPISGLRTMPVNNVYIDTKQPLKVIDKQNGGKADAINAGINFSDGQYICTIDADSILDESSLKMVVEPFILIEDTLVSGGQLAASNGLYIKDNKIINAKTPSNIWVIWQIIEYIRSFMISRRSLSRLNALLIMSGAFSMFRKTEVLAVGGFLSKENNHSYITATVGKNKHTVCEDMEIVVRLYRYRKQEKKRSKVTFLPCPVCWTEVPDKGSKLFKQRSRWHQGLAESILLHRKIMLEPSYGSLGLFGLPYYFFFELLAPVIKILAILFIAVSIWFGTINLKWMILILLAVLLLTAIITSTITALVEYWSIKQSETNRAALRYKSFKDWMWFVFAGIAGEFTFSFYKIFAQLNGLYSYMKGKTDWKKFERKGIKVK